MMQMIRHPDFENNERGKRKLRQLIRKREIVFAGNSFLKIYGTLQCKSGKRMLRKNRVFFSSEKEAIENGYRPCGHCLHDKYAEWKKIEIK
jgi:methylphosphotriester-DNA--protein-cysteine methyltransferase